MNKSYWTTHKNILKEGLKRGCAVSDQSPFAATVDPQYDPLYFDSIKDLDL